MNKPVRIEPRIFQDKHCFYLRTLMGGLKRFKTLSEAQKAKNDDIAAHGNKVKMWANVEGERHIQQRCDGRYFRARVYIAKESHEKVSKNLDVVLRFRDFWLSKKNEHKLLTAKPKKEKPVKIKEVKVKKPRKPQPQPKRIESLIYLTPSNKYLVVIKNIVAKVFDTLEQARQCRDDAVAERDKAKLAKPKPEKVIKPKKVIAVKSKRQPKPEPEPKYTHEEVKQIRETSRKRSIKKQKTDAALNAAIAAMNRQNAVKKEKVIINPIDVITNRTLTVQERLQQLRAM